MATSWSESRILINCALDFLKVRFVKFIACPSIKSQLVAKSNCALIHVYIQCS